MRESKYLRLALMFGDNNATTFGKNLEKMIALVLHDKYGEDLTILQIIEELKDNYGLDFSETEIIDSINGKHQNRIICMSKYRDYSLNTYSITPAEKERIDTKIANTMIKDAISRFLCENPEIEITADEFEGVLKQYFYGIFNSNATTISELLDQKLCFDVETDIEFSEEEKSNINSFLEWNNTEKDKCVYQMVSCCFDYCMMTVKRDKNIYQNIFRQKKFYLDTNIVFRMMGLNRENRKKLISTFIRKCKEVGIELSFTNLTRQEIYNTIEYHVKQIRDLMQHNEPISIDSVRSMTSKFYNLSFYEAYANWCEDPANRVGDYASFANDLKIQANHILCEFTRYDFDDYKFKCRDEYTRLCESFKTYKSARKGYARDEVVQTDVNNYMYIRSQNEKNSAADFFSTHNYLISADHVLGDWAREQRPGSVPIVVLPSVWYSLILQYTGRADDDFASFTRFLNFSLVSYDEEDPRKLAILKKVISLDEPKEIKERTIYDIERKLSTDYKDFDSVEEIVQTSHEFILDQERAKITAEVQQLADKKIANITEEAKKTEERIKQETHNKLLQEQNRHEQAELELTMKNKELLDKVEEAKKQGARERAESLANNALRRRVTIYWGVTVVLGVIFLMLAVMLVWLLAKGSMPWFPKAYEKAAAIIDAIVEIILGIMEAIFIRGLCGMDKKAIKEKLVEKYMK